MLETEDGQRPVKASERERERDRERERERERERGEGWGLLDRIMLRVGSTPALYHFIELIIVLKA